MFPLDPIDLTRALIRCPSVTPDDAGALAVLENVLRPLGFICRRLRFESQNSPPIENLYARLGQGSPHFCFAGHTDVVPVGDLGAWTVAPFGGEIIGDRLFGRGAVDMKGGIGAFVAAVSRFRASHNIGSISLLITGDEEGPAINGTRKVLDWMAENGERPDGCVVGEPTGVKSLGDVMKIGRRGSLNGRLTVYGAQGHVAYPHLADNPLPRLARMLVDISQTPLDSGSAHFDPSALTLTTIDVGNPTTNVIPAKGEAGFNIRFNDLHTPTGLEAWLRRRFDAVGGGYDLKLAVSGESFLTPPGPLAEAMARAVKSVVDRTPEPNTGGGTSDARFIKNICPVVEFGLVGTSMHKVDENVATIDLLHLAEIYHVFLLNFFGLEA
ncbi:Succinyl-diaminopimelate desuccinylase [Azospirillaceae bacterium]